MKAPGAFLLQRLNKTPFATYGSFDESDRLVGVSLELPDLGNLPDRSCVPAGTYEAQLLWSPAHKRELFHLLDVPGRSAVEIHVGNLPKDILGCIILGAGFANVYNVDANENQPGIIQSRVTFETWMSSMATRGYTQFTLEIRDPVVLADVVAGSALKTEGQMDSGMVEMAGDDAATR